MTIDKIFKLKKNTSGNPEELKICQGIPALINDLKLGIRKNWSLPILWLIELNKSLKTDPKHPRGLSSFLNL